MRPIVVTYDAGAVSPRELAHGLDGLGPLVFLVPDSAHVHRVRDVLGQLGKVLPLTHNADLDTTVIRALRPAAILTFSETLLRVTAVLAHAVGLPFHDIETAHVLTDKQRQRQRLRDAGVDDVRHCPLRSADDWPAAAAHVGLPAVIKPVHGAASRHTHLVTDLATGTRLLGEIFGRCRTDASVPVMIGVEYLVGASGLPFGD
jgi:hypothetical protein